MTPTLSPTAWKVLEALRQAEWLSYKTARNSVLQDLRKLGLATVVQIHNRDAPGKYRWVITAAGRAALEERGEG